MATLGYRDHSYFDRNYSSYIPVKEDYQVQVNHFKNISVDDMFYVIIYKTGNIGKRTHVLPIAIEKLPVKEIVMKYAGTDGWKEDKRKEDYGCFLYFRTENPNVEERDKEFSVRINDITEDGIVDSSYKHYKTSDFKYIFTDRAEAEAEFQKQQKQCTDSIVEFIKNDYERLMKTMYEADLIKESIIESKTDLIKFINSFGTDAVKDSIASDPASLKLYMTRLDKEY